jgi:hypothetical protein
MIFALIKGLLDYHRYIIHFSISLFAYSITMPSNNAFTFGSEKEWPVELFRHTENEGWQQQMPRGNQCSSILAVAPRKDCIVIAALRQKFTLSGRGSGTANDGVDDDPRDRSSVVRRYDCILLVSRRRTRAMVLKFRNLRDCQEFSDRFMELNPRMLTPSSSEQDIATEPADEEDRQEVMSYVARLLHDGDFLRFVNKVETFVGNTVDGAKILEALETRDLEHTLNPNHFTMN